MRANQMRLVGNVKVLNHQDVEESPARVQLVEKIGGASRDRTDDLIVANDALSQLSYSPTVRV